MQNTSTPYKPLQKSCPNMKSGSALVSRFTWVPQIRLPEDHLSQYEDLIICPTIVGQACSNCNRHSNPLQKEGKQEAHSSH